jgi:hypothetical protein
MTKGETIFLIGMLAMFIGACLVSLNFIVSAVFFIIGLLVMIVSVGRCDECELK